GNGRAPSVQAVQNDADIGRRARVGSRRLLLAHELARAGSELESTRMANLLLVDRDGRRRVRLEVAAQQAGHRTYSAGTAAEALWMAGFYVPDAVLLMGDLPDSTASAFVKSLRDSPRAAIQCVPVITPDNLALPADSRVIKAPDSRPEVWLTAVE